MWLEDIEGSSAYARALNRADLLSEHETDAIIEGLELIKPEWQEGRFHIKDEDEDIHTANERRLKVGSGTVLIS